MYDFIILTPTFNRCKILQLMIDQLIPEINKHKFKVKHIIVDDASTENYSDMLKQYQKEKYYSYQYMRLKENNGKHLFWKTYNILFSQLKPLQFKFAYITSDDMLLCKNFLIRTRENFQSIRRKEPNTVCLNLWFDYSKKWKFDRWEDGFIIVTRDFFEALDWKITPISLKRWKKKSNLSSGVHAQISSRFHKSKYQLSKFQNISYVKHRNVDSVMYPKIKSKRKARFGLGMKNFIDVKL